MELSKKKATFLNMLLGAAYQIVTALFGFILPNLLLNTFGAELHGYTSTVGSIMGYISLINAGLAPAAVQALYEPLAKKDNNRINEVLNAIDRFYIRSGCLYTISVLVCAFVLPVFISEQIPDYLVVSLMIVIGATSTLDCFVYSKYRVLLQADQRLFVVSTVDTIVYFFRIASQVILILLDQNILLVMGIPAVMVIVRTIILARYCRRTYPHLNSKVKPDSSALSKRWSAMFHQISGLVVYNTDVTLLTLFGSLIQVSIYSVYNLVFSHIYNLLTNIFSVGTLASFGQVMNEGRRETLLRAFDIYEYVYYMVVSFVYGVSASMILPFVSIYTKKYVDIPYVDVKLAILFMIIGFANNMRVPCGTMINAAGHFKETQWRAVLESIINIVVSLLLIRPLGMYGLLIGTICSFAYRTTDIIYYSHKHILMCSCRKSVFRVLRTAFSILLSVWFYYVFIHIYTMDSWFMWILYSVLDSLITIAIVCTVNLITERKVFLECIKLVYRRKHAE